VSNDRVRLRRLEPAAIGGVMSRELANFRTYWRGTTFSSVLEPIVYLLAFGLGLSATLVDEVGGVPYVQYVGTGMVATAVIFSSAMPAMFGTFVKHRFQNTYDAILAAPVDVEELVSAEMLWIGLRASVYGCVPLLVTLGFGLDPMPGMLLTPLFCLATALGFAGFGVTMAATVAKIDASATPPEASELRILASVPIFAPLPGGSLEHLAARLVPLRVDAGTVIVREGDAGDRFYIVAEGEIEVSQYDRPISELAAGGYFGEIALLRDVPRTATVTAKTATVLYALDRDDFLAAVTGHPQSSEAAETVMSARLSGPASTGYRSAAT